MLSNLHTLAPHIAMDGRSKDNKKGEMEIATNHQGFHSTLNIHLKTSMVASR